MCKSLIFVLMVGISQQLVCCTTTTAKPTTTSLLPPSDIKSRKFQTQFIAQLNELVDTAAADPLDHLLQELRTSKDYASYTEKIQTAASSTQLVSKIVYLKQLLDIKLNEQPHSVESLYTLRNLNFLGKLKHQLLQLQDESIAELRHFRWYNLCRQFWFRDGLNQTEASAHQVTPPPSTHYWFDTKLAPLRAENVAANATPPLAHIDLERFASTVYANVKSAGAEIIDDYLLTVRKLLQEVIEQKLISSAEEDETEGIPHTGEAHVLHESKLVKGLAELDAILAIDDFYAKRNLLYSYLGNDLPTSSHFSPEDLAVILAKLQSKGVDLFVTFIFSNFEFLEHLHETWAKLLPSTSANEAKAVSQHLFDAHRLYVEFKGDWENSERYDAYMAVVKALHAETRNGGANMHVFELLNNASANVGTVTLNMIKEKCREF
ncbi:uncharacterized protein LOC129247135 [Anastrepha obliqua]|uniref:uncharacterized protein LOC129247135 n=1 Tax=Anastrepha obliqua TaxID=95512 RepID=UPI002409C154|nr:uncharacterized protein LOC129247135 [Anastrepha obliqua]